MTGSENAQVARRLLICALLLGACSKHDVQYPTPWLRVDVMRPRADELIRVGSLEERYEVKVADRWQKLGVGHRSGYTILGEEALTAPAALVNLDDPSSRLLVRSDAPPRCLRGDIYFANGVTVDVLQKSERRAHIDRYDALNNATTSFDVSIPDSYSDCQINGIKGYATGSVPYIEATCGASSQARCLVIAAGKRQAVYAVKQEQPESDCAFTELHLEYGTPTYRHFD